MMHALPCYECDGWTDRHEGKKSGRLYVSKNNKILIIIWMQRTTLTRPSRSTSQRQRRPTTRPAASASSTPPSTPSCSCSPHSLPSWPTTSRASVCLSPASSRRWSFSSWAPLPHLRSTMRSNCENIRFSPKLFSPISCFLSFSMWHFQIFGCLAVYCFGCCWGL